MAHLFVSYARENKADVDELVRHLDALGNQTWLDSSLRGGQSWWEEILRRIAECDAFVAIVSRDTLNSVACKRELQWALALDKPVLPVAVEQLPEALPRDLSTRQIVDYSHHGQEAAFALAGGLAALPSAPPPPEQLPDPPPAPLSYLSDLVDKVSQPEPLTHEQQRAILVQLQPALHSADPEERRGGYYVLDMFSRREDLYADVDRALGQLEIREAELLASPDHQRTIDELLDRAVSAINRGDKVAADSLASRVLEVDRSNPDAEELLAAPAGSGEIRRMTIMFVDLVGSTALSMRVEPEVYRTVVGRYRDEVLQIVDRYEGHVASPKGDGLLAVFGYPHAHEDDVRRAVQAGLDITRKVAGLSQRVRSRLGVDIDVRVGVHHGLVYLDTEQDDVYGFAANFAERICTLAEPGSVVISETVEQLISRRFELVALVPKPVKGVDGLVSHFRVVAERELTRVPAGPLVGRVREIAYLEESWARAKAGTLETAGVVIHGEAGIGKSRLARVGLDMAELAHAVVLELMGSPLHTGAGMYPVRRLLERRCGITPASDTTERLRHLEREIKERRLDTATVVPLLAPVLGIPPESGYQAVQAEGRKLHDQIAGAVHDYLLACMREGPTLVVVEDMQWFDQDTIEVVHSLLGEKLGRVLIVMTGRELASLPDSSQAQVFTSR